MYLCQLINNGVVVESFYRPGTSAKAVKEALDMFQWPKGQWVIEAV